MHYTIEELSPGLSQSTRIIQINALLKYGIIKNEGSIYRHKEGHSIEIPSKYIRSKPILKTQYKLF